MHLYIHTGCSLNIVFFPRILESLPPLPRQLSAALGCTKNYQPIGVSFKGLLQQCRRGRGYSELWKKNHNFSWTLSWTHNFSCCFIVGYWLKIHFSLWTFLWIYSFVHASPIRSLSYKFVNEENTGRFFWDIQIIFIFGIVYLLALSNRSTVRKISRRLFISIHRR